jgi:ornithine carbamoyltransferase
MPKNITKITDLSKEEILQILKEASSMNYQYLSVGCNAPYFKGKNMVMIFEKPSLRTRVAFEVAAKQLGGDAIYLTSSDILASGSNTHGRESIPDIAKNLENFADIILARVYEHKTIEALAENSSIPVINGLCDLHHPTQTLADLYTIYEIFGGFPSWLKIAYVGDGNNVAGSLLLGCDLLGINFHIASPSGYEISDKVLSLAKGNSYKMFEDPYEAVKDADIIYTDTWVSMGQEKEFEKRMKVFKSYQVNDKLLSYASSGVKVMHCLPAHRGEEITDDVIDGEQSVVFAQSKARMIIAKALLKFLVEQ